MRANTIIVSVLLLAAYLGFAQAQVVPTIHILPEDVVQSSIQLFRVGSNSFVVRWTYTEAGAQKMLAFWEAQNGQKACTEVGSYVSQPAEIVFRPMPPAFTNYVQWKEGWLKHRTDKIFCASETDAHEILAGLKSQRRCAVAERRVSNARFHFQ